MRFASSSGKRWKRWAPTTFTSPVFRRAVASLGSYLQNSWHPSRVSHANARALGWCRFSRRARQRKLRLLRFSTSAQRISSFRLRKCGGRSKSWERGATFLGYGSMLKATWVTNYRELAPSMRCMTSSVLSTVERRRARHSLQMDRLFARRPCTGALCFFCTAHSRVSRSTRTPLTVGVSCCLRSARSWCLRHPHASSTCRWGFPEFQTSETFLAGSTTPRTPAQPRSRWMRFATLYWRRRSLWGQETCTSQASRRALVSLGSFSPSSWRLLRVSHATAPAQAWCLS
mmetsp:Transcript_79862/g.222386  ORF Transcript_79862/g.222386 Transcript_79862/m.222386 type:complete len:287 (-) Transcript_79862:237-1097(-)